MEMGYKTLIDMMELRYHSDSSKLNCLFNELQSYLRLKYPSGQLRNKYKKKKQYEEIMVSYVTNALSYHGFEEIRLSKTVYGDHFVAIELRPKLLIDPKGYYKLTTLPEFELVRQKFNHIMIDEVGLSVPEFDNWIAKRIEPAVDIYAGEDLIPLYIQLAKKGNIPNNILNNKTTIKYWESSINAYMVAETITANWYNRYEKYRKEAAMKLKKNHLDYSETKGLIRIEKQVKECNRPVNEILNHDYLRNEIMGIFLQIVGRGDYYTLDNAIKMIDKHEPSFRVRMELIRFLRLIAECGSIFIAREIYIHDKGVKTAADKFRKKINKLHHLGVNPVLLPTEWGFPKLPNLIKKIEAELKPEERFVI